MLSGSSSPSRLSLRWPGVHAFLFCGRAPRCLATVKYDAIASTFTALTRPNDVAKFPVVVPRPNCRSSLRPVQPRTSLGMVSVEVDKTAPPLVERLELDVEMDDDLILFGQCTLKPAPGSVRCLLL